MKKVLWVFTFFTGLAGGLLPFRLSSGIIVQNGTAPKPIPLKFPKGYFIVPVQDSILKIAGNFGEIRPNHFHAGLDIKTGGREGMPVYAAADGYVSRIKISPFGYGKAVYITHPNGYVTVYGHLQRLCGRLEKYLELEQYRLESYEVDLLPDSSLLKVKQHDLIAISGNTGGSQSPHLHFEVRDAATEHAYNPFLFGFKIADTVPPVLSLLKIYPATDSDFINGKNTAKKIGVFGKRGRYRIAPQAITVSGAVGFGIETTDYGNIREAGKLGAYSIELSIDDKRIYYHELNEIGFEESRYINSHIDYAEEAQSSRTVQKCFRDENNMLSIYQCVLNEGIYRVSDAAVHQVRFVAKDFFGNSSTLQFSIQGSKSLPARKPVKTDPARQFHCCDENVFENREVKINIPPCTLYEDIDFSYSESKDTVHGSFSAVHQVHKGNVPVHSPYTLSIRVKSIPERLRSKATVVLLDGKNNKTDQKGTYETGAGGTGWVTTHPKNFGRFAVVLDTVPPTVRPYNIYNGKNMSRAKILGVIISDNLTNIKSYRGTIDGKWILMEYEYKKALLFYEFDDRILPGKHHFEVTVTDEKDNARTYKADFSR